MHYYALVLVEGDRTVKADRFHSIIGKAMWPYSEHLEMPEYEEECYCVGRLAMDEVKKLADEKFGTIKEMGEKNRIALQEDPILKAEFEEVLEKFKAANPGWESDEGKLNYLKHEAGLVSWRRDYHARKQWELEQWEQHPGKNDPDPNCGRYTEAWWTSPDLAKHRPAHVKPGDRYEDGSGCGGTGRVMSTSNPDGHWDWWQIGGRWTGRLKPDYDPHSDPANIERCDLCGGTGRRRDELAVGWETIRLLRKALPDDKRIELFTTTEHFIIDQERLNTGSVLDALNGTVPEGVDEVFLIELREAFKVACDLGSHCNGCDGKGRRTSYPYSWAPVGCVETVKHVLSLHLAGRDVLPYTILHPDGDGHWDWHFRARTDTKEFMEKTREEWETEVLSILGDFPDHIAVVVDYHN